MKHIGKKKKKNLMSSPIVLIIFVGLLIIIAREVLILANKNKFSTEKHDRYATELQELEEKSERLKNNIKMLETDRGMEQKIREKFRVIKNGEEIIIIIDNESSELGN